MKITIYSGPPLFIMSPRIKVYDAKQVWEGEGYLSSFHSDEPVCDQSFTVSTWVKNDPQP